MSSFERSQELVDKLTAQGIVATDNPRSAIPPCVLVAPPDRTYDLACGYTARWQLWAIVPPPGDADAHRALDQLADDVAAVLPVERATLQTYVTTPDAPPLPAYRIEFSEGI